VPPDADREAIERAYERAARKYHPDISLPPLHAEKMREVDEAFDVLDDPAKRAHYDSQRAARPSEIEPRRVRPPLVRDPYMWAGVLLLTTGVAVLAGTAAVLLLTALDRDGAEPLEVTTPRGLRYIDLEIGSGRMPQTGDTVVIHYVGTLEDGTVFDDTRSFGQPFQFRFGIGGVIAGFDEGVATMREGGKRRLVVPPELAYGDEGFGGRIPPGATLIFEVELLEIR
jgi:hypothetical protein